MAALGKLVVSLSANIAEFTSAMDKAAYVADQRMAKIVGVAKVAGAALAGAFTLDQVVGTFMQFTDAADEAVKAAQRVGMSVESLQKLQFAAEMSGVASDDLNTAMGKLAKAAADGNDAFSAMGVSVKNADGTLKATDELLGEVADKFASYRDGAEKSALAQEIFGKSGASLIPLLNGGSAGLRDMAEEAEQLGFVFSEQTGKAAEQFNDNLTRLGKVKDGIVAKIAAGLLPMMENLSSMMVDAAKNTQFFDGVAKVLTATIKGLAAAGAMVWGVFDALGTTIAAVAVAVMQAAKGNFAIAQQVLESGGRQIVATAKGTVDTVMQVLKDAEARSEASAPKSGGLAAPLTNAVKQAKAARDNLKKEADAAAKEAERIRKALEGEGEGVRKSVRTPIEVLGEDVARLNVLLKEGVITWDTYSRAVFKAQDDYDKTLEQGKEATTEFTDQVKDDFSELQRAIEGWGKDSAAAIVNFAMGAKTSFSDMVNSILADIARMLVYRTITQPIFSALGSQFSTASTYGTIPFSQQTQMLAAQDAGLAGARAYGGPVQSGRTYLIGESGPELLTMGASSGFVTPNSALGGSTQVVVNNFSNVQATAAETVDSRGNRRVEVTVGEMVAGELRRTGSAPYEAMRSSFGARPALVGR